ncbi:GntR family transcriptional regulator [Ferrovibrio sp.]|uniref:GntR family transcriptional regulator n=1 Tax=Ferrovibrio sp. TaxID=1917215 RepID=UPI0025BD4440|nr:GntR family transcriptional regulator [Ferrovibrio sp.]MBX3454947.1 GntR family transcriptional regulator [Ferrovibrio sp.]
MTSARLREAIAEGRFMPGERVVERQLCELMGVSRTSVREALRELETEGLVTVVPNKGPFISVISVQQAESIYQVRAVLEGLAVRLFAQRATDGQIEELSHAVDELEKVYAAFEVKAFLSTKARFYQILLDGAGNEIAGQMLRNIHIRASQLRATSLSTPQRAQKSIGEIRLLLQAIKARDPDAAWAACVKHVEHAADTALAMLRAQEKQETPPLRTMLG